MNTNQEIQNVSSLAEGEKRADRIMSLTVSLLRPNAQASSSLAQTTANEVKQMYTHVYSRAGRWLTI